MSHAFPSIFKRVLLIALSGVGLLLSQLAFADQVTVYAAASLKESVDEIARQIEAETKDKIIISYGASSALAKQIENGAPADVFISADLDWMDYLASRKLIQVSTRKNLLSNQLVLIAPLNAKPSIKISPNFPLASLLGTEKLAMANPDSVPAGKYGKAALEYLGVWSAVSGQVARTDNVRGALALVSRAEAPLGIVYRTDALADRKVSIVDSFPAESHPAIVYPVSLTVTAKMPAAKRFTDYLHSDKARLVWQKYGFTVLK